MSKTVKRLFEQFIPSNYQLTIHPDKKNMRFTGTVVITGKKVGRPSQRLTFHQKELKVLSATIVQHSKKSDQEIVVSRINYQRSFDEVRLHTDAQLFAGNYTITLTFEGSITRPMNGLYPCFFQHDKHEQIILATQFESHHAREVFPCIDEPEAKATFDLTLIAPKDEVILANTPEKKRTAKGELATVSFETTPIMSTYLLAFVIGQLEYLESKTKAGTVVRVYATPDKIGQTQFALDFAVKCLEFYNEYFAIPYPLQKCDMVALPDFASGAMENWGLITYREQTLLVDPKHTSLPTKQYVAMVVAHELAHQWFGNLVTMRWWTDLWLNEGFASWIEYLAVDHVMPDWNMWTQYIANEQQIALKLDALENTHPVEVTVKHPDEIRTIFDAISYNKGSSVIHMLHEYLGPEAFRDGLRYYLKEHAYKNTDTIDLWHALETVSDKPVKNFMHTWTAEPGYPIVHAQVDEKKVTLRQERFLLNRGHVKISAETIWPTPLLVPEPEAASLLDKKELSFELPETQAFKLNAKQAGFYRTVYNSSHVHRLAELVHRGKLEPIDRLGILSDVFEAAKAGYTPTDDALQLLEKFEQEDSVVVWDIISSNIADLRSTMDDEDLRETMKPFVRQLVSKQFTRLGWDERKNDSYFDLLLRPLILGMASGAEDPDIIKEAQKRFASKPGQLNPDIRGVVYATVAREGDQATFDSLVKLYRTTTNSEEHVTLAAALSNFKQPEIIDQYLAMITSKDVRLQDVSYWVAYIFMNRHAKAKAWDWFKANWQWLHENLGTDMAFSRFPVYIARVYSNVAFLKEYTAFFEDVMSPALERSVKQGIEIIQWRSAWRERDFKEIKSFFKNRA